MSTVLLISDSIDHPLLHFRGLLSPSRFFPCPPVSLWSPPALWLTVRCGRGTAPGWTCLFPRGAPGPTSGPENSLHCGAAPVLPHTTCMSSSGDDEKDTRSTQYNSVLSVWPVINYVTVQKLVDRERFSLLFSVFSPQFDVIETGFVPYSKDLKKFFHALTWKIINNFKLTNRLHKIYYYFIICLNLVELRKS